MKHHDAEDALTGPATDASHNASGAGGSQIPIDVDGAFSTSTARTEAESVAGVQAAAAHVAPALTAEVADLRSATEGVAVARGRLTRCCSLSDASVRARCSGWLSGSCSS